MRQQIVTILKELCEDTKLRDINRYKSIGFSYVSFLITECRMEFVRKEFGIDRHSVEGREK